MANTTVVAAPATDYGTRERMVWVSPEVGYLFYIEDTTVIPKYKKTTTGPAGLAGATPVTIAAAQGGTASSYGISVIWEEENGFENGAAILHIFYGNATDLKIYHKSLPLDTDILSAEHTVYTVVGMAGTSMMSWDGTMTPNGDLFFIFKTSSDAADNKLMRSQDGGATWAAMAGTVPAPGSSLYPNRVLLPWTLWDGAGEDLVMVTQDSASDDCMVHVYDISTTTWSAGTSIGRDGDYVVTSTSGMCIDAVRYSANGHLYVIARFAVNGNGYSCVEVSSTGQGNITITVRPDMVPDTAPNNSYYGIGCGLCCVQSTGMLYGFFFADMTFTTAAEKDAQMIPYTIATNLWGDQVLWSDRASDERMRQHYCLNRSIPTTKGGQVCPVWYNDDPDQWLINEANSFEVAAGGGGGGGGDPIQDVEEIKGITSIL